MSQTYSHRIVSLHLEQCKHGCPNRDVCYLRKRDSFDDRHIPYSIRDDLLVMGFKVYDAICRPLDDDDLSRLLKYNNYNITISEIDYNASVIRDKLPKSKIQKSIYDTNGLKDNDGTTRLFLIKDRQSFELAKEMVSLGYDNIHFSVDAHVEIPYIHIFLLQNDKKNITVDVCLYSWFMYECCPYEGNYIDISYDCTVRNCPFSTSGIQIPLEILNNKAYDKLFNLVDSRQNCKYKDYFNGVIDEYKRNKKKNTCI